MADATESQRTSGPRSRPWGRHLARAAVVLVLLAALCVAGGVAWATRTASGRRAVATWVERGLEGAVDGRVEIGSITGGNLLTRAEVSGLSIREADGQPFLVLEDVSAEYDPLSFLLGRYAFRKVRLERARLVLRQDEDGTWNFDRLFPDDAAAADTTGGTHLSLHDVRVRGGRVEVRTPYESTVPDSQEVWRLERTPEGRTIRTIEVDSLAGRFPLLRIADPDAPLLLDLEDVSGRALAVRQALPVRGADVTAVFRDTVRVWVGGARVGRSSVEGDGWVVPEDPAQYRFDLRAEPLDFRDLQWLPVPAPRLGGGPADLVLRSEGEDFAVDVRHGDVRIADSRVRGDLSVVAAETPRIDTLDVELDPLRLSRVDRILDRPTVVDGYLEGRLRGRGPVDRLHLAGELSARDTAGGSASRIRLAGGVSLFEPNPVHDLRMEVEAFEPKWAGIVTVRPRLAGRARGSLFLDGSPEETMTFSADLVHRSASDSVTRLRAEGRVADRGQEELRLEAEVSPLALDAVDPYLPRVDLRGAVRGTLRTEGDLSALRADAELATAEGELDAAGTFRLAADRVAYDARVAAGRVQLQGWLESAPYTRLNLRGSVRGTGTAPGELEAEVDLTLLPSVVEGAAVDTSHVRFGVQEGVAAVESLDVRTDVGRLRGRGSFGLEEEREGSLSLTGEVTDLASWNRWLVPGRNPVGRDTTVAELFEGFPDEADGTGVAGVGPEEAGPDTLAGRLTVRGAVEGNVEDYSVTGRLRADSLVYGPLAADSVAVAVDAFLAQGMDSLAARAEARGLRFGPRTRLDSAAVRWTHGGPAANRVRLYAGRDTSVEVEGEANVAWTERRKELRLDRLRLRVEPQELRLEEEAAVRWDEEGLTVSDLRLSGGRGVRVRADGRLLGDGRAKFDLQLRNFDLGVVEPLYPLEVDYAGTVDGALQVRGRAEAPEMSGFVTVSQPAYAGVGFDSLAASFQYRERSVDFRSELRGRSGDPVLTADGTVAVNLAFESVEDRIPDDPVDVRLSAERLPLRIVEIATESVREVEGTASGDLRISGTPGSFRYDGRLEATGMSAYLPALNVRYGAERGATRFEGGEARLDSVTLSSSAGGRLLASGTIGLARLTDPALDLTLTARKLRAIDRRDMSLTVDGSGRLSGSYEQPHLQGDVQISNGEVSVTRFMREREVVDLTDPEAYALIDTTLAADQKLLRELRNPFLQNLRAEAQLRVGPGLWLRSPQLDVELAGELRVRMQPDQEQLQLFGPLQLVRGRYRYSAGPYSRQFQIEDGTIEFVGTPGVNPNLDVTARYRTRDPSGTLLTIQLHVGGTLINKRLTLSSDAQISESDQICYLLFGSPCVQLAGVSQGGGAGLTQTVQEQLVGTVGSQLSSFLVADTWLDYATVQTSSLYGGAASGGGRADFLSSSFFTGTEVEAGKYLGQDVFVSVTYPLGSDLPGATLEWQFRRNWTLEARSENRFGRGRFSLGVGAFDTRRLWGLFLFREWGF